MTKLNKVGGPFSLYESIFPITFYISWICLQRAQKLNPMVKITVDKESLASKDEEFFKDFHVVILTNATEEQMVRISEICHKLGNYNR